MRFPAGKVQRRRLGLLWLPARSERACGMAGAMALFQVMCPECAAALQTKLPGGWAEPN